MSLLMGTLQDGIIVPDEPLDGPNGTRVHFDFSPDPTLGIRDEDWPTDPEGIEKHLQLMDQFETLEMADDFEVIVVPRGRD